MLVKICGLRTLEQARGAARAGADLLGFVFAPSRRQLSVAAAATIIAALRAELGAGAPAMVGLFVNRPVAEINDVAVLAGLDYLQLSGDETVAEAQGLARPLIKSLRLDGRPSEQGWLDDERAAALLLVDAHVAGSYGGSGVLADWGRAAELARRRALLLAGGLTPENVGRGIAQVQPAGVDVSSGVESDGVKDLTKVRAFIAAARTCFNTT